MTYFFSIFKKPCFWAILGPFSQFWDKNFFLKSSALSYTTSYGLLASCQTLEKTNDIIPRKRPNRWMDG